MLVDVHSGLDEFDYDRFEVRIKGVGAGDEVNIADIVAVIDIIAQEVC